jgi:hypothetical protein
MLLLHVNGLILHRSSHSAATEAHATNRGGRSALGPSEEQIVSIQACRPRLWQPGAPGLRDVHDRRTTCEHAQERSACPNSPSLPSKMIFVTAASASPSCCGFRRAPSPRTAFHLLIVAQAQSSELGLNWNESNAAVASVYLGRRGTFDGGGESPRRRAAVDMYSCAARDGCKLSLNAINRRL